MRKRGARFNRTRGHVLTPQHIQKLMMPIHVAIELLPAGCFTMDHALDLVVCTNILQCAAEDARRPDLLERGKLMARTLYEMKCRHDTTQEWTVTNDERKTLMESAVVIDRWMRKITTTRFIAACNRVDRQAVSAYLNGAGLIEPTQTAGGSAA